VYIGYVYLQRWNTTTVHTETSWCRSQDMDKILRKRTGWRILHQAVSQSAIHELSSEFREAPKPRRHSADMRLWNKGE
jgi:hypothetical protein